MALSPKSLDTYDSVKKWTEWERCEDDFVITELEKAGFFKDVLKNDEVSILGHNEDYIFSFNDRIPDVICDMLGMKMQRSNCDEDTVDIENLLEALKKDTFRTLLLGNGYATVIDIDWPKLFETNTSFGEYKISAYPTKRKVPFAYLGSESLGEMDILPVIKSYPKCITPDELAKRIMERYTEESEKTIRSKAGNSILSYVH